RSPYRKQSPSHHITENSIPWSLSSTDCHFSKGRFAGSNNPVCVSRLGMQGWLISMTILRISLGVVVVAVASVPAGSVDRENIYGPPVTPPSTRARLGLDLDAAIGVLRRRL